MMAGVIFVEENGKGPGVSLHKPRTGPASIAIEDLNAETGVMPAWIF